MTDEFFLELIRDLLVGFSSSIAAEKAMSKNFYQDPAAQHTSLRVPTPESAEVEPVFKEESHLLKIRVDHAVNLILAGWRWSMSRSRLGEILGFDSVYEFERILQDKSAMTYKFLEHLCEPFGMNQEWLKYGTGTPFEYFRLENTVTVLHRVDQFLECIQKENVTDIHFVKEDNANEDSEQEAIFVLQFDEFKFKVLNPGLFIRGSQMSSNTEHSLCGFYNILKHMLYPKGRGEPRCNGWIIDRDTFLSMIRRELYPRVITQLDKAQSNWPWDLVDLESIDKHEQIYGKEFVKAQEYLSRFCANNQDALNAIG